MSSAVVQLHPNVPADIPSPRRRSRRKVQLEEQKRSFLRMVSHELRTPLNSIIGFSDILSTELYGPLGAPQYKSYAEHVKQSGHKLLRLVNQVLEIARLEGRVTDLDISAELVEPAVDEVVAGLRDEIAARQIQVHVEPCGPGVAVVADPRGLRTVIGNLLQNAITFSPVGGEVSITTRTQGDQVEIAVHDQGPGVDPADIERLLKPFEQGGSALTRTSEGAGLGLPIAQLYCTAMGGVLRLQSSPGEGLTASILITRAS